MAQTYGGFGMAYYMRYGIDWGEPDEGRPEEWDRYQWFDETDESPYPHTEAVKEVTARRIELNDPMLGRIIRRYVIMTPVEEVRLT